MNILFVGIRGIEDEITSAPKKISNALYNKMTKNHDNVFFFGLPWEGDKLPEDNDHVLVADLKALGKFIEDKEIDTVYLSRYYTKLAMHLVLLKLKYKFKLVYTVHGIIKKERLINKTFKYYSVVVEGTFLKACDSIIVVSGGLKEELLKFYPSLDKNKVTVIFNGVEVKPVQNPIDIRKAFNIDVNKKILFTAGTRKIKNNETLIEAIISNKELNDSVFLLIAGAADTEYSKGLMEKYKTLNNVKFTGEISVDMIYNIYSQMDLYIQISSFETFGIAIVEALLHKKRTLISKELPIAEYLTNEEVWLYNPQSDLSQALLLALREMDPINEKGANKARELFNWDTISEEYYNTFMKII